MTGVRVCCTLLSAKDRAIIHFMVQAMNGKVSTSLDKNVTISINIFKSTFLSVTFSAFFFFLTLFCLYLTNYPTLFAIYFFLALGNSCRSRS